MQEKTTTKNRKHNRIRSILVLVVSALLVSCFSCQQSEMYYRFSEIKNGEWQKYDTLYFHIDSLEWGTYDISIEMTNNIKYPYQDVWLFTADNLAVDAVFENRKMRQQVADESGKYLGSGFGSLYQSSIPYRKAIVIDSQSDRIIKITHGMRDDVLMGIEKIGIKITREE